MRVDISYISDGSYIVDTVIDNKLEEIATVYKLNKAINIAKDYIEDAGATKGDVIMIFTGVILEWSGNKWNRIVPV